VAAHPREKRLLVTGHESLGYFAQRYGFTLVGALVPRLSTEAETSVSPLASLVKLVKARHVSVIFTELGRLPAVTSALARDAGAKAVALVTHALPADGSYATFITDLASTVVASFRWTGVTAPRARCTAAAGRRRASAAPGVDGISPAKDGSSLSDPLALDRLSPANQ
jgi:hypothetical protein